MIFNALKFYQDYNIPHWTEGKNVQEGWVNICCPFCTDKSNHLGYNLHKGYFHCWLCGWHLIDDVLISLLKTTLYEALKIKKEYSLISKPKSKKDKKQPTSLELPLGTRDLSPIQKDYLRNRNFDPDKLIRKFSLKGTGNIGEHKFRIIAPIYFNSKLVSYQGRTIKNNMSPKYKACKKSLEIIHHKHILYNIDNAKNKAIIVEGITDVWGLGHGSIATMGIGFTQKQILLIKQKFEKAFILFDYNAQERANKLAVALSGIGVSVEILQLEKGDPADMSQEEADNLMKEILK